MNSQLDSYLRMLAGPPEGHAGRWLDVRWREASRRSGISRVFIPATATRCAIPEILTLGERTDVFIGVALHDRKAGNQASVSRSHLAWADIDHPAAQEILDRFPHPPTMTIASGSAGRRHAYWLLKRPVTIQEALAANRMLAAALSVPGVDGTLAGGDLSSGLSAVSMLRPPGTYNHKHTPPAPVEVLQLAGSRIYSLRTLTAGLTDPHPPRTASRRAPEPLARLSVTNPRTEQADEALRSPDARDWLPRLTGQELVADDRARCPLHADGQERTPSLKAYPNGSWYCYACHQGGSIFDFAAALWDTDTHGVAFVQLRAQLARKLLGIELPTPTTRRAHVRPAATEKEPVTSHQ